MSGKCKPRGRAALKRWRVLFLVALSVVPAIAWAASSRWVLTGTVVSGSAMASYAILRNPASGEQGVYARGARLRPGMKLIRITSSYVVVESQGTRRRLWFGADLGQPRRQMRILRRSELWNALSRMAGGKAPIELLPYQRSGKVEGYYANRVRPGSIAQRMGLRAGDIITRVNGIALNGHENTDRLLGLLRTSQEITLYVRRRGSVRRLSYALR